MEDSEYKLVEEAFPPLSPDEFEVCLKARYNGKEGVFIYDRFDGDDLDFAYWSGRNEITGIQLFFAEPSVKEGDILEIKCGKEPISKVSIKAEPFWKFWQDNPVQYNYLKEKLSFVGLNGFKA